MLFTPGQFFILAVVLIAGFLLGYASRPSTRKWRERVRDQSKSFTAYHEDAEDRLRAANARARALEAEAAALRSDHAEAEHTSAALRATAATPAADPAAPRIVDPVDEHLIAAGLSEPVADASPDARGLRVPLAEPVSEPVSEDAPHTADERPLPAPEPGQEAFDERQAARERAPVLSTTTAPAPAQVAQSAARPAFGIGPAPALTPGAGEPAPIGLATPALPAKGWFGSSGRDDLTRVRGIDDALNLRLFSLGVLRFEDLEKLSAQDEMALEQRLVLAPGYIAREQWRAQAALLHAGNDTEHSQRFGTAEPATA